MNLVKWLRARFRRQREVILLSQLRIPKEWVGELIEVEFLDHTQDDKDLGHMIARGRLESFDVEQIVLLPWENTVEVKPEDYVESSTCRAVFRIVRSTITAITRLERKERKRRYEN